MTRVTCVFELQSCCQLYSTAHGQRLHTAYRHKYSTHTANTSDPRNHRQVDAPSTKNLASQVAVSPPHTSRPAHDHCMHETRCNSTAGLRAQEPGLRPGRKSVTSECAAQACAFVPRSRAVFELRPPFKVQRVKLIHVHSMRHTRKLQHTDTTHTPGFHFSRNICIGSNIRLPRPLAARQPACRHCKMIHAHQAYA